MLEATNNIMKLFILTLVSILLVSCGSNIPAEKQVKIDELVFYKNWLKKSEGDKALEEELKRDISRLEKELR